MVRERRPDLESDFLDFVTLIREDGLIKPWPPDAVKSRRHNTYLELDGWDYWTMGDPSSRPLSSTGSSSALSRAMVDSTVWVPETRSWLVRRRFGIR
jgi:hypothetical protein